MEPVTNSLYRIINTLGDKIEIGDVTSTNFVPIIRLTRWNEECELSFDCGERQLSSAQVLDNSVIWETPFFTFKYYLKDEDNFEYEIVLKVKTSRNFWIFPLQLENLVAYHQPPLTREFTPEDCVELSETHVILKGSLMEINRPTNVVNSIAFYHKTRTNMHKSVEDAEKYQTGKAFHLYRPECVDADGKRTWGDFTLDANGNVVMTIPQDFLDTAKYPVTIDPTFGYTGNGATGGNQWGNNKIACLFNLPENGNVTSISWSQRDYNESGGTAITYGIYNASNVFKGATQAGVTTAGRTWVTLNYGSPLSLTSGDHWLAVLLSARTEFWYDSGSANQWKTNADTYSDGFADPFGSASMNAWKMSIYATYTAGATLQTVTDSLALSESVLRNKALLPVSDSVGLADSLYGNKLLLLGDSASLSELVTVIIGGVMKYVMDSVNIVDLAFALKTLKTSDSLTLVDAVSTPSRVLNALDAIGATDNAAVNKVLQITDTVSLAEIVEVGAGGVKKTKLFLILGDLAVQLTGD